VRILLGWFSGEICEKWCFAVVFWWFVSGKKCGKCGWRAGVFLGSRNRHFSSLLLRSCGRLFGVGGLSEAVAKDGHRSFGGWFEDRRVGTRLGNNYQWQRRTDMDAFIVERKSGSRVARMPTSQNRDVGHPILWEATRHVNNSPNA
jgi:hypothetical protein